MGRTLSRSALQLSVATWAVSPVMSGEGAGAAPHLDHTGGGGDSRDDPSQIPRYLNMTQHRQRGQLGADSCLCSPLSWLIREMEH